MPLAVTRLTEPLNRQRLRVIGVMGVGAADPTAGATGIGTNELSCGHGSEHQLMRPSFFRIGGFETLDVGFVGARRTPAAPVAILGSVAPSAYVSSHARLGAEAPTPALQATQLRREVSPAVLAHANDCTPNPPAGNYVNYAISIGN